MFAAIYGATPWQMPPEAALGLMLNLSTANAWKTLPVAQGVGMAICGKDMSETLQAMLLGEAPSIRSDIEAAFERGNNSAGRNRPWQ